MTPRHRLASTKSFEELFQLLFYCPGCSTWRTNTRVTPSTTLRFSQSTRIRRYNSTLVSSTAVNATKRVPPRYKELYEALQDVQKKAPAQINQSRLQLALSGLETHTPVTRVAGMRSSSYLDARFYPTNTYSSGCQSICDSEKGCTTVTR